MEGIKKTARYYQRLQKNGRFEPDFFEFVRRIEQHSDQRNVGKSSGFQQEAVRFGQIPYLHFPESSIGSIQEKEHLLLLVYFMGLTGVNGPLPLEHTSFIYQRSHNYYDYSVQRFNDIINHRFIGLFYRAWKANEQSVGLDKKDGGLITAMISALGGNPSGNPALPEFTAAAWSGLCAPQYRSRDGLQELLRGFFRLPLEIHEKEISVHDIPAEYRARLGKSNTTLGHDIQLGGNFYSCTHKFTISTGVVTYAEGAKFLPGNPGFEQLTGLVRHYLDKVLDYDLCINIKTNSLPAPELNGSLQLGRNIWLKNNSGHSVTQLKIGASRLAESRHRRSQSRNENRKDDAVWAN